MESTFQEKSAWGLLGGIVVVSLFYFPAAFTIVAEAPHPAPLIAISAVGVIALVVIEIVYHTVIAAWSPKDAGAFDERDRLIDLRAERNGGFALGIALFSLVGWIILQSFSGDGSFTQPLAIAVWILLALTISEVVKLASQIAYYRIGG